MAREGRGISPFQIYFWAHFQSICYSDSMVIVIQILVIIQLLMLKIDFFQFVVQPFYIQCSGNSSFDQIPIRWSVGPSLVLSLRTNWHIATGVGVEAGGGRGLWPPRIFPNPPLNFSCKSNPVYMLCMLCMYMVCEYGFIHIRRVASSNTDHLILLNLLQAVAVPLLAFLQHTAQWSSQLLPLRPVGLPCS